MKISDLALLTGATLRLTRFVTTDSLGDWTIVEPAKLWAATREGVVFEGVDSVTVRLDHSHQRVIPGLRSGEAELHPALGWRSKLVSGLECPHCVGFWLGAGVTAAYLLTKDRAVGRRAWRIGAGILGLNYVTAHISARLD